MGLTDDECSQNPRRAQGPQWKITRDRVLRGRADLIGYPTDARVVEGDPRTAWDVVSMLLAYHGYESGRSVPQWREITPGVYAVFSVFSVFSGTVPERPEDYGLKLEDTLIRVIDAWTYGQ